LVYLSDPLIVTLIRYTTGAIISTTIIHTTIANIITTIIRTDTGTGATTVIGTTMMIKPKRFAVAASAATKQSRSKTAR
jgi:hypothetical protein